MPTNTSCRTYRVTFVVTDTPADGNDNEFMLMKAIAADIKPKGLTAGLTVSEFRIEQQDDGAMTVETHHELCLGVLAGCYPHVPADLQQAITEGITAAAELGFLVSTKNLAKGGPLFTGGYA